MGTQPALLSQPVGVYGLIYGLLGRKTGFPGAVKNPPTTQEMQVRSLDQEDSPGGHGNPLQNSFRGKSHGQRSLVGYSPWGRKESDTTEVAEHSTAGRKVELGQICVVLRVRLCLNSVHLCTSEG